MLNKHSGDWQQGINRRLTPTCHQASKQAGGLQSQSLIRWSPADRVICSSVPVSSFLALINPLAFTPKNVFANKILPSRKYRSLKKSLLNFWTPHISRTQLVFFTRFSKNKILIEDILCTQTLFRVKIWFLLKWQKSFRMVHGEK